MASISVFKLKNRNAKGQIVESKNYYFYHNRKKINTKIQEKRSAQLYAEQYVLEKEANIVAKQNLLKEDKTETNTLLLKLKKEGWISFNSEGEYLYDNNPKYKLAKNTEGMTYSVKQAKQVGRILFRVLETHKDHLGNIPYNKITKVDAFDFRNRLADYEMPNSMKNEALKALRAVYTFWENDPTIFYNPFKKTRSFQDFPKDTKDERDTFSDTELKTIFNKTLMKTLYPDDKEWLYFLESDYYKSYLFCALTGLRSAEVRCLIPSQISNDRILTIDRAFKENNTKIKSIGLPKCGKTRVIVLCDSAYDVIAENLMDIDDNSYIFKNKRNNNAIEASRWNKMFVYFMDKIKAKYPIVFGGRYFTPHCLRKTLNTLLVYKYQCSPELVIDYLGWGEDGTKSSLTKVQKKHYTFTKAENLLVVAQTIERMFSGKEMLWSMLGGHSDKSTDLELKKMNMLFLAGIGNE